MSGHATIINLGAITADSIRSGVQETEGIYIPNIFTSGDTFATLNAEQTLTNKTLTAPVIDTIITEDGGEVVIPEVFSGNRITLATTDDVSAAAVNMDTSSLVDVGTVNYEIGRIDRLLTYLENWISVGNLTMTGITNAVNYDDKEFAAIVKITNGVVYLYIKKMPWNNYNNQINISTITAIKEEGGEAQSISFTSTSTPTVLYIYTFADSYTTMSGYHDNHITFNFADGRTFEVNKDDFLTNGYVLLATPQRPSSEFS